VRNRRIGHHRGAAYHPRSRPAATALEPRGFYAAGVYTTLPKELQPPRREKKEVNTAISELLNELEELLAQCEEVRYRLAHELSQDQDHAQPAPQTAATTVRNNNGELATESLSRTGPGLWAWAKEFGHTTALTDLGRAAAFPRRMVDWDTQQVEQAVDALAQLVAGGSQPTHHAKPLRPARRWTNGRKTYDQQ